jgi:hypothetical protein
LYHAFEWRSSRFDLSIQAEVEVTVARVKGGAEVLLEPSGWNPTGKAAPTQRGCFFSSVLDSVR